MSSTSDNNNKRKDGCFECRLVGGLGLIGASIYVVSTVRKSSKTTNKAFGIILGGALFGVGVARLLNFPRPSQ